MNNISDINNTIFNLHQYSNYTGDNIFGSCDKESISETPLTFHDGSPSSSIPSNIVNTTTANTRRQPRGKINKRACMNCRKLKVKCDGDALAGKDCTNCAKGTCVFDQSPRKNRQVENLNRQIDGLEETLRKTQENLDKQQETLEKQQETLEKQQEKIDIIELERDISQSLFKCLLRFQHESELLSKLSNIVNETSCRPVLVLLSNILSRLLEGNEDLSKIIPTLNIILDLSLNPSDLLTLQIEEMQNNNIFNISIIDDNNVVIPSNNNNNMIHSNINSNINSPILPSSPSNSPSSCNYNYNLHPNSNRNVSSTSTTPIMTTPISTSNHSFSNNNNIINSPAISDIFAPSTNENNNDFNSPSFIINDNLYYLYQ